MTKSHTIKAASLIAIILGLCAIYFIASRLYVSPFQVPTPGLAGQRGDKMIMSLQEIGNYALGVQYYQGVGNRVTALLAFTIFLPIFIFLIVILRRYFSEKWNRLLFVVTGIFMLMGTLYFIKKVLDGLAGLEWGPVPNMFAMWILLWMVSWFAIASVMATPLNKRLTIF